MGLRRRTLVPLAVIATVALVLSGCGRSTSDSTGGVSLAEKRPNASAKELLPDEYKESGVLEVATAVGYPPMEMYKDGTHKLVGVDPDLARAIADQLGLEVKLTTASFPGLIPGLRSGQWDLAMSSMSDTAERQRAVDFVDYFRTGGVVVVPKGNPANIESLADLCGKSVVLAKGSSNLAIGERQNKKCDDKMRIIRSEDAPTGLVLLDSGRAVATIIDYPVAVRYAEKGKKYTVLPKQYDSGPWGIAVAKSNSELRDAVARALQELMKSGRYSRILKKWGVSSSAVDEVTINGTPIRGKR